MQIYRCCLREKETVPIVPPTVRQHYSCSSDLPESGFVTSVHDGAFEPAQPFAQRAIGTDDELVAGQDAAGDHPLGVYRLCESQLHEPRVGAQDAVPGVRHLAELETQRGRVQGRAGCSRG